MQLFRGTGGGGGGGGGGDGGGGGEGHSYVHTILTLSVHTPSQYLTVKFIRADPEKTSVHEPIS